MKTFVHLRLKQYIEKHNIIVEKIAKEMKVNKGSLYNYFNGKTEIRLSILEKFVKINPTINIEWLLTGVGNMDHEVDNFAREDNDSYEKMCKKYEEYKMMIEDYRSHNKLLQENLDDCKYQLKKALNDSDRGRGGDTEKKKGRIIQGIFSPKTVNEKNKNMLHYFGKVITLPYKLPQYKK